MRLQLALAVILVAACTPAAGRPEVILATTTSTQDSGLLDVLIPDFERRSGYKVKTAAVGSGAALALGARGEADVILVHAPEAEGEFMRTGAAERRVLVMHNDFVLVGPEGDPARATGRSVLDALRAVTAAEASFISRGDRSGTDLLEKKLWRDAGILPSGPWYVESGTGMGQTLRVASERRAYTLTDRATYLALRSNLSLTIVVEREAALLNVYHVIVISPTRFPAVNAQGANAFADYLVSPAAQALIAAFGRDRFGESLFVPDAGKAEESLGE